MMKRRRFLGMVPAGLAGWLAGCDRDPGIWRWRGVLFQSPVEVAVAGVAEEAVGGLVSAIEREVRRAEAAFSLFEPGSEVARLNRDGELQAPSAGLLEVLEFALGLAEQTAGVFDPTIQPYWRMLWNAEDGRVTEEDRRRAEALVDYRRVELGVERVRFGRVGMAVTLNAVAQGYVADRVAGLLRTAGVTSALVNMGEFVAIGRHPSGRRWTLDVRRAGRDGAVVGTMALEDEGLAVSSGGGYRFGTGAANHLVQPTGGYAPIDRVVAVRAPRAMVADGLATACGLVGQEAMVQLRERFPGVQVRTW